MIQSGAFNLDLAPTNVSKTRTQIYRINADKPGNKFDSLDPLFLRASASSTKATEFLVMNIDVSKEEYAKLVDLLYMASVVATANGTRDTPVTRSYEAVIQKFFALASRMDQGDKIVYDFDLEKFLPAESFERSSAARTLLDEFTDESFWHELIERLTDRDLEHQVGGADKLRSLSMEERFDLETPVEERYLDEFEQHGIERLEIVEQFPLTPEKSRTSD